MSSVLTKPDGSLRKEPRCVNQLPPPKLSQVLTGTPNVLSMGTVSCSRMPVPDQRRTPIFIYHCSPMLDQPMLTIYEEDLEFYDKCAPGSVL